MGARLQVQKTEDLDKEREAGLPKTTLDTELKVMSGSCHLDRASNDEFSVECLF